MYHSHITLTIHHWSVQWWQNNVRSCLREFINKNREAFINLQQKTTWTLVLPHLWNITKQSQSNSDQILKVTCKSSKNLTQLLYVAKFGFWCFAKWFWWWQLLAFSQVSRNKNCVKKIQSKIKKNKVYKKFSQGSRKTRVYKTNCISSAEGLNMYATLSLYT